MPTLHQLQRQWQVVEILVPIRASQQLHDGSPEWPTRGQDASTLAHQIAVGNDAVYNDAWRTRARLRRFYI